MVIPFFCGGFLAKVYILTYYRQGSIVCDFKVSIVADSFTVDPTIVNARLHEGFERHRGVIFEHFDVDKGSLATTTLVPTTSSTSTTTMYVS